MAVPSWEGVQERGKRCEMSTFPAERHQGNGLIPPRALISKNLTFEGVQEGECRKVTVIDGWRDVAKEGE